MNLTHSGGYNRGREKGKEKKEERAAGLQRIAENNRAKFRFFDAGNESSRRDRGSRFSTRCKRKRVGPETRAGGAGRGRKRERGSPLGVEMKESETQAERSGRRKFWTMFGWKTM